MATETSAAGSLCCEGYSPGMSSGAVGEGPELDLAGVAAEVCIDTSDPRAVVPFWMQLLGYRTNDDLDGAWIHLEPPHSKLPVLNFQRVPEPKTGKNRLHLDVFVTDPQAWIERAESLGATRIRLHDDPADWFQLMADPEASEFCICRENQPAADQPPA
jgi:hypothetical protein